MLGKETAKEVDGFVDRNQSYMKISKIIFSLMRSQRFSEKFFFPHKVEFKQNLNRNSLLNKHK